MKVVAVRAPIIATMTNTQTRPDAPAPIVAREGWPIVALFVIITIIASVGARFIHPYAASIVGFVGVVLSGWCIWFFRDPPRAIPTDPLSVVSPADGRICMIGPAVPPADLKLDPAITKDMVRVCVFMNVFNVHVNRAPVAGVVEQVHYSPGKFLNAAVDKASTDNERSALVLKMPDGRRIVSIQIAGLIARRIICRVKAGISLIAGERYGLIRFGSRVDVYMPAGTVVKVQLGQIVVAGETVLAELQPAVSARGSEAATLASAGA